MRCRILALDISGFIDEPADSGAANPVLLKVDEPHFSGLYASSEQAARRLAALLLEVASFAPSAEPANDRGTSGDRAGCRPGVVAPVWP